MSKYLLFFGTIPPNAHGKKTHSAFSVAIDFSKKGYKLYMNMVIITISL